jgi:hypothetical protein
MPRFGGSGQNLTLKGVPTNVVTLAAGQTMLIGPAGSGGFPVAGEYGIRTGPYTTLQVKDPITGIWKRIGGGVMAGGYEYIYSDGVNYRLANQSGCAVGALLTNGGSGYTSAPTVTASAGSSIWQAFVGGAVNTTVTVSNGGANYTYPPQVLFSAPPYGGGIQATGICTLSSGAVSTVTITNQGAGYPTAPTITFVNDPREGVNGVVAGYNAAAVATLTGSGTVTGVVCLDHGTARTAVPTLSFAGGGGASAAATAIMCWGITAYTPTAGTGFTGPSLLSGLDAFPTTSAAYVNPDTQSKLVQTRRAEILMPASAGAPTATGAVFYDSGVYTSTPTALVTTNGALITQTATFSFTMGGTTDTSWIQQN